MSAGARAVQRRAHSNMKDSSVKVLLPWCDSRGYTPIRKLPSSKCCRSGPNPASSVSSDNHFARYYQAVLNPRPVQTQAYNVEAGDAR
jgi:hypothetical protein